MFNILSQITLTVKFLSNEEQHCLFPSLVDDFTCVHSKNSLLTHILSTLSSSTSVLFSCTPFGTKSYQFSALQRGPAGAGRSKTSIRVNYTDIRQMQVFHLVTQIIKAASCGVNFLTFGFCTPHNQHFHFWFRPFAGKIALSSKTTGKCSHLVHFGYCHSVIKHLMRNMMNYHCLRVFRSRVKRQENTRPVFICSEPECMAVPCSDPEHRRSSMRDQRLRSMLSSSSG